MTTLLDLAAELRSTHAAVRRMEEMVSARPDDDALEINMLSLRKRQLSLERQFAELADRDLSKARRGWRSGRNFKLRQYRASRG